MQNIALIIAGGYGQRMGQDIPKQFLNVQDKPVILYTLAAFQKHPCIDGIVVVCVEGWEKILDTYCRQYAITKLENIVSGGSNGQESIWKGVQDIASRHENEDLVLVHDAIRPLVSEEMISDCIRVAGQFGNAVSVVPCNTAMLCTEDGITSSGQISRDNLKVTQTPQCASVGMLLKAHEEAQKKGITNSVATCTLFTELGYRLYFSLGSEKNIKLTSIDDLEIFEALLEAKKMEGMK